MKTQKAPSRVHIESQPLAAIALKRPKAAASRWGFWLIVFMRVLSVLWIAQGLYAWMLILAPQYAGQPDFQLVPDARAGSIIFFCVIDLIAAVGLWLTAAWGGVLWLFDALAKSVLAITMPLLIRGGLTMPIATFVLLTAYFVLNFLAAREGDR
ncbi:DUF6163 family protein [Methylovirgula sp. 4M-Z18]|uniref:DUF6163 family protein n=1 Tax=Methylovirgula sp. 4M-Z18 TaxID=2293567 RepID=UPI000E2EA2FD|nr:DUF6163 family protein [Methylovirgula sp. 4M-Z18]RFB80308.1 hypothetical protein DYH55_01890 [Methylovirgula sp. 4M-Z18]